MAVNDYVASFMAEFPFQGLTFDDVSLVTQYADFLPDEAVVRSRLTSRIDVNMPFLSAAPLFRCVAAGREASGCSRPNGATWLTACRLSC